MFSSGHKPQIAGISGIVAVVAHHEIVAGRHFADHAFGTVAAVFRWRELLFTPGTKKALGIRVEGMRCSTSPSFSELWAK